MVRNPPTETRILIPHIWGVRVLHICIHEACIPFSSYIRIGLNKNIIKICGILNGGGLRLNLENIVKNCQKYEKILSLVTYDLRKRFCQAGLKAHITLPSPFPA